MNRHALVSEKKPQSTEKDAEEPSALQLPSAPTSTLDTSLAKAYTHIHPVLVLAAFFARFQSLVADPSATLLNSLAIVGLLQIVYVVTCLPPTTNTTAASPKTPQKQGRGSKAKSGKGDASAVSRIVPALLSHLLTIVLATPVLTILIILFGAPITTHLPLTTLCAAHMASLAIMPLVYVHGVDSQRWREVVALMSPSDEVFGAAVGTMVGAWAGAVPIPLDWDREWQRWPVTIVSGAYAGWALGKLVGATILRGKRLNLT